MSEAIQSVELPIVANDQLLNSSRYVTQASEPPIQGVSIPPEATTKSLPYGNLIAPEKPINPSYQVAAVPIGVTPAVGDRVPRTSGSHDDPCACKPVPNEDGTVLYMKKKFGCPVHQLPIVEIRYNNLTHEVPISLKQLDSSGGQPNFFRALHRTLEKIRGFFFPRLKDEMKLKVIGGNSGVLSPGTATLIIGSPGAGNTTFLKLLSGRIKVQHPEQLLYNGQTVDQLHKSGVMLQRLVSYCYETDVHEPLLTVQETFDFSYRTGVADCASKRMYLGKHLTREQEEQVRRQDLRKAEWEKEKATGRNESIKGDTGSSQQEKRIPEGATSPQVIAPLGEETNPCTHCEPMNTSEMIDLLGLREAAETIVGSDMIRGVSGGQKRRVSIGEALIMNARVFCGDSITAGLDAATAFSIVKSIVDRAHSTGGIVVVVLQQPSPALFQLFDKVILLGGNGQEIYHGPPSMLADYFQELGYVCPTYMDMADFVSEFVVDPVRAGELSVEDQITVRNNCLKSRSSSLRRISRSCSFESEGSIAEFEKQKEGQELSGQNGCEADALRIPTVMYPTSPLSERQTAGIDDANTLEGRSYQLQAEGSEQRPLLPPIQHGGSGTTEAKDTSSHGITAKDSSTFSHKPSATPKGTNALQILVSNPLENHFHPESDERTRTGTHSTFSEAENVCGTILYPKLNTIPELVEYWRNSPALANMMGTGKLYDPVIQTKDEKATGKVGSLAAAPIADNVTGRPRSDTLSSAGGLKSSRSRLALAREEELSKHVGKQKLSLHERVERINYGLYPREPLEGGVPLLNNYTHQQYTSKHNIPLWRQVLLLANRQKKLILRNRNLLVARLMTSTIMGAILATLFINPPPSQFQLRFGLSLFACIFIGFSNNAEVPSAIQSRKVAYRQTAAAQYDEFALVWCIVLCSIPVALIAGIIFSSLIYWPTNFAKSFSRYLVFFLVIFLIDLFMASYLRIMAFLCRTQEVAQAVGLIAISLWLLFSGFYVIRNQIPVWLSWLCFISPFFWAVTALANNEFHSDRYSAPSSTQPGAPSQGELYMAQYDYLYSIVAQWGGVIFIAGLWLLIALILSPLAIKYIRYDDDAGTARLPSTILDGAQAKDVRNIAKKHPSLLQDVPLALAEDVSPSEAEKLRAAHQVKQVEAKEKEGETRRTKAKPQSALEFPRVTLAYQDIQYTVSIKRSKTGETKRKLLSNVTGYAKPGTMTALMGATGAGKTTLLDVLAFRKTAGVVEGTITLNGIKATPANIAQVTAYAEQEDIHYPLATVRESLMFSHRLRYVDRHKRPMPKKIQRETVNRILHLLELDTIANRLVHSLSRGELKRLTIGVELVSNPAVLFLDEPTTGLDSRSAAVVMRVLQRVASTGRSVVATIHQPSAEIFFGFTHLLLLQPGGKMVYFGELGEHASKFVDYFEEIPGVSPLPLGTNPANWMMDVIAETMRNTQTADENPRLEDQGASIQDEKRDTAESVEPTTINIEKGVPRKMTSSPRTDQGRWEEERMGISADELESPRRERQAKAASPYRDLKETEEPRNVVAVSGASVDLSDYYSKSALYRTAQIETQTLIDVVPVNIYTPIGDDADTQPHQLKDTTESDTEAGKGQGSGVTIAEAVRNSQSSRELAYHAEAPPVPTPRGMVIQGTGIPQGTASKASLAYPAAVSSPIPRDTLMAAQQVDTGGPASGQGTGEISFSGGNMYRQGTTTNYAAATSLAKLTVPLPMEDEARVDQVPRTATTEQKPGIATAEHHVVPIEAKEKTGKIDPLKEKKIETVPGRLEDPGLVVNIQSKSGTARSWPYQVKEVLHRSNLDYWRNTEMVTVRFCENLFLGVLFGILFLNNDPLTFAGTQSLMGFALSGTAFAALIFYSTGQNLQFERRGVYYRERAARYYHGTAYSLSALLVEIPYVIVISLFFVGPCYWIAGLRASAASFFFFWLNSIILSAFFMALSITYTALLPTLPIAQLVGGLSISLSFLFAGLFAPASQIPSGWIGMYYAVPTSHILRAISVNQFFCVGGAAAGCPQISTVGPNGEPITIDRFQYVTNYLKLQNVNHEYLWDEVGWAALSFLVVAFVGVIALQFISWQRR